PFLRLTTNPERLVTEIPKFRRYSAEAITIGTATAEEDATSSTTTSKRAAPFLADEILAKLEAPAGGQTDGKQSALWNEVWLRGRRHLVTWFILSVIQGLLTNLARP
ncbi:unnamed protein product, partial [Amoebophrya sp. A120]